MGDNTCTCNRLTAVVGDGNKVNDVVFCGDVSEVPEANVLFFGGDVQVRNFFRNIWCISLYVGYVRTYIFFIIIIFFLCLFPLFSS